MSTMQTGAGMITGAPQVFASTRTTDLRGGSNGSMDATLKRLVESIAVSWKAKKRIRMLSEYWNVRRLWSGPLADMHEWPYGNDNDFKFKSEDPAPMNVMHQAIAAIIANVAAGDPTVEVNPKWMATLRGYAELVAAHSTNRLEQMRYIDEERDCLLDALMGMAVMKIGEYGLGYELEWAGSKYEPGRAFICRVSPADYGVSHAARSRGEAEYEFERYRTTTDKLLSVLTPEEIDRLPKTADRTDGSRDAYRVGVDGFVEFHDLIDVYIPPRVMSREALILTVAGDPKGLTTLGDGWRDRLLVREPREFDGPRDGPYEVYGFNHVQDSPYYAAPMPVLREMAQMVGDLSRHIMDSDATAANVIMHRSVDDAEAERVRNAKNLDMIEVEDPSAYTQIQRGGSTDRSQQSLAMHVQYWGFFSGSGQTAGTGMGKKGDTTATEVEDLSARLNVMLEAMEREVYRHADRVLEKFLDYELRSPTLNEEVTLRIAGVEQSFMLTGAQANMYQFQRGSLRVRRGSMRRHDDQTRAKRMLEWATASIPIGVQTKMALGDGFDMMGFLKVTSKGIVDPVDLDTILPDPMGMAMAVAKTNAAIGGGQAAPSDGTELRKPGTPGSSAIMGASLTGNRAPTFDNASIASNTVNAGE